MSNVQTPPVLKWQAYFFLIVGAWSILQTPIVYLGVIAFRDIVKILASGTVAGMPAFLMFSGAIAITVAARTDPTSSTSHRLWIIGVVALRHGVATVGSLVLWASIGQSPKIMVAAPAAFGLLLMAYGAGLLWRDSRAAPAV